MSLIDLDTPEALAVIKGEPHTVGFRHGTVTLPTVLLFISSGPSLSESLPYEAVGLGEFLVWDISHKPGDLYRKTMWFIGLEGAVRGKSVRADLLPERITVYLEAREEPATLVRLFRAIRDHCDSGLKLCDCRGDALFEGDVR